MADELLIRLEAWKHTPNEGDPIIDTLLADIAEAHQRIIDHMEADESRRELVKKLDSILSHGQSTAKQPALCDLIHPAKILANQAVRTFQERVKPWMMACFGAEISQDITERNHRFLEEALELVQSTGCTADEAHQLVDYVYGRDVGEPPQEVGGVMVTLAALCLAIGENMDNCAEVELARIWTKVDAIRAKQAAKPKHGPLPGPSQ